MKRLIDATRPLSAAAAFGILAAPAAAQVVYDADASPNYRDQFNQLRERSAPVNHLLFELGDRWPGSGSNGEHLVITFSFVRDGTDISAFPMASGTSQLFSTLDATFTAVGVDERAAWFNVFDDALTDWESVSGVRFAIVLRSQGDPADPDDDPLVNFWDELEPPAIPGDPSTESVSFPDTNGPLDPLSGGVRVGDIRIAMGSIDGPGGVLAMSNRDSANDQRDIVLDVAENWGGQTPDGRFAVLENVVTQVIGHAIGLSTTCPDDSSRIMGPTLFFDGTILDGPQEDDIRAIHDLYGDAGLLGTSVSGGFLDNNMPERAIQLLDPEIDSIGDSFTNTFTRLGGDSIDEVDEFDYFFFEGPRVSNFQDGSYSINIAPFADNLTSPDYLSGPPGVGGVCDPATLQTIMPLQQRTLLVDVWSLGTDANDLQFPDVVIDAPLDSANATALGEAVTIERELTSEADAGNAESEFFLIRVTAVDGDPEDVQRYSIEVVVTSGDRGEFVVDTGSIIERQRLSSRRLGFESNSQVGATVVTINSPIGSALGPGDIFTGAGIVVGTLDGQHVWPDHQVFDGRTIPQITWNGTRLPGENTVSAHATQVGGLISANPFLFSTLPTTRILFTNDFSSGQPVPVFLDPSGSSSNLNSNFLSVAPDAFLVSGAVAQRGAVFGDFFVTSTDALGFSLFTMTDIAFSQSAGLPAPATVINSAFGQLSTTDASDLISLMHDAAVNQYNVTVVAAAGNNGMIDRTEQCSDESDENEPGGLFPGARTINTPASAFNVITVGAAAFDTQSGDAGAGGAGPAGLAQHVAPFSSKGPANAFDYEEGDLIQDSAPRPGVDVVAIGVGQLNPRFFVDETCPQFNRQVFSRIALPTLDPTDPDPTAFTSNTDPDDPNAEIGVEGTCIAAATVTGLVALLQESAAYRLDRLGDGDSFVTPEDFIIPEAGDSGFPTPSELFPLRLDAQGNPDPLSIDPLVMKAIILNSATKLIGWSNTDEPGTDQVVGGGGVGCADDELIGAENVTVPLDLAQGAGLINGTRALFQYHFGLTDWDVTDPRRPTVGVPPLAFETPFFTASGRDADQDSSEPERDGQTLDALKTPRSEHEAKAIIAAAQAASGPRTRTYSRSLGFFGDEDPVLGPIGGGGNGSGPGGGFDAPPRIPVGGIPPVSAPIPNIGPVGVPPVEINPLDVEIFPPYGWDIGNLDTAVVRNGEFSQVPVNYIDYEIGPIFSDTLDPQDFIATLVWNRNIQMARPRASNLANPNFGDLTAIGFENLNLELYQGSPNFNGELIASSTSEWSSVEHIVFPIPEGGGPFFYTLRVIHDSQLYDVFLNDAVAEVKYAVAWRVDDDYDEATFCMGAMRLASDAGLSQLETSRRAVKDILDTLPRFGATILDRHYDISADHNQDGIVNLADITWQFDRLQHVGVISGERNNTLSSRN